MYLPHTSTKFTIASLLFIVVVIVIFGKFFIPTPYLSKKNAPATLRVSTLTIASTTFTVEIADTEVLHEQGLSDRVSLPQGSGMFFIFPIPDQYGFWMKDMNFPLDIVWIDHAMRVVDVSYSADPASYSRTFPSRSVVFKPKVPVQYVLEINAGEFHKNNLTIGDIVSIQ